MQLKKIYSNNQKFQAIHFSRGLNIILGDIDSSKKIDFSSEESEALEHNLGKTALLHLIDFLLLKGSLFVKEHIEPFNLDNESWVFFLEIKLNDNKYVTIRRSFNNPSKVSFKGHLESGQDYTDEEQWDYMDIGMSSKDNPKDILQSQYLRFTVCTNDSYRDFLGYLMRTQNDYQDIFQLDKFRGKDKYWKPQLFRLLGFNGDLLLNKYEHTEKIVDGERKIGELDYSPEKDDINKIIALLGAKENERDSIKQKVDSFNFFEGDQEINKDLTQNIINRISLLNREEYKINLSLRQIDRALNDEDSIERMNIKDISRLFEEINIVFPNDLKKSLQDLITFSKSITSERSIYFKTEKQNLEEQKNKIIEELSALNSSWSDKLGTITETDGFYKYDKYRENLSLLDAEIIGMKHKQELHQKYKKIDEDIKTYKSEVVKLTEEIDKEISLRKEHNFYFNKISDLFTRIYKDIFEGTAVIYPSINKEGNIEFKETVQNQSNNMNSAQGNGNTSKMALCASFALALIIAYGLGSFYRFTYLDGAFEGWGDAHKKKFIDMVKVYADDYDIQVIVTIIKSDIPDDLFFEDFEIKKRLLKGSELFGVRF